MIGVVRPSRSKPAHLDAVDIRQPEIEHDQIRGLALDRLHRPLAAHRRQHLVPASAQQRRHRCENIRLVVDDEDSQRHVYISWVATGWPTPGMTIVKHAPPPAAFSPQTRPPSAASRPRVIASPIPLPAVLWRADVPR